jgi:hypothetical protein
MSAHLRCVCPHCGGAIYLRLEDYLAAHERPPAASAPVEQLRLWDGPP